MTEVDITVVSDGSTDRTVELRPRYEDQIRLIVFDREPRLRRGHQGGVAELRCGPARLSRRRRHLRPELVRRPLQPRARRSRRTWCSDAGSTGRARCRSLRRVGNFLFALMLTVFSSQRVRDTASGMRVVRRSSLPKLMPLPDGMHFTPAMSARAILCDDLRIVEVDMPYHERAGESKLRVVRDGLRFLRVIVEAAFLYRPSRPLGLARGRVRRRRRRADRRPTVYYLEHRQIPEWMIYRFVVSSLLTTSA